MRMRGRKHPEYSKSSQQSKTTCINHRCGTVRHCLFDVTVVAKASWNTSLVNDYSTWLHLSAEERSIILIDTYSRNSLYRLSQDKWGRRGHLIGRTRRTTTSGPAPQSAVVQMDMSCKWIKLSLKQPQWWQFLCTDSSPPVYRLGSSKSDTSGSKRTCWIWMLFQVVGFIGLHTTGQSCVLRCHLPTMPRCKEENH